MIRNKMLLIVILLFLGALSAYSAGTDLIKDRRSLDDAKLTQQHLQQLHRYDILITSLQKERGLSTIYVAGPNETTRRALLQQRCQTDSMFNDTSLENVKQLAQKRAALIIQVDQKHDAKDIFSHYTTIIMQPLHTSENIIFESQNAQIKNLMIIYLLLKNAQEELGSIRAKVGAILVTKHLNDETLHEIIALDALYHNLLLQSSIHLPPRFHDLSSKIELDPSIQKSFKIVERLIHRDSGTLDMSALEWFTLATHAVNAIDTSSQTYFSHLTHHADENRRAAEETLLRHLLFWGGGSLTLLILLLILWRNTKVLADKHNLLENYKEAIDYSTIVSKANKHGIITYVNSAFCNISGYEANELLHQPHNILRHPDMPAEVFAGMWHEIKAGKRWNGIVKNLKKDGTPYWVDASISPIYDHQGNLVEYIAIRHGITEMIMLTEEIQQTQSELIYRMGEAVESRSQESGNHIRRVAYYSRLLAELAGLSLEECEIIFAASTMHDIGKLAIPDAILLKKGTLNEQELISMQHHAEIGYNILKGSQRPLLNMAATVAYEHHEHFDGKGYPRALKGEEISIYGRIVAITDVFDALASDRVYKEAWPLENIFNYLTSQSSRQFDPRLVELFLRHKNQFIEIKKTFNDDLTAA